jgi:hypothetical protein
MARAKKKAQKEKPAVQPHLITLTPDAVEALESLRSDASDYTGRAVSRSALIRAVLRLARQQGTTWLYEKVCPFIEAEMQEGLRWGDQKK